MVINVYVVDSGQGGTSNKSDEVWRPRRLSVEHLNEDERRTEEFLRSARSLLNKLSPVNFCKIIERVKALSIDSLPKLDGFISLVVEKAVNEPKFSRWYLEMLCSVSDVIVLDQISESNHQCKSLFALKLLTQFETVLNRQKQAEIDACIDPVNKLELEEFEAKLRFTFRGVGLVIGLAFVLQILTTEMVRYYIETLLTLDDENSPDCLCRLLTVAGQLLEFQDPDDMERYFDAIKVKSENLTLSTRIRFMLSDLLDFRTNSWISHSTLRNLKAIDGVLTHLSDTYEKPSNQSSAISDESTYLIDPEEAQCINNIFNKFTQCRRNLTEVLYCFEEIAPEKRSRIIQVFITCVVKCDIYSGDCGKLFAILLHSKTIAVQSIVDGIKAVIKGYYENLIFTDQQIWTHIKEIFTALFSENVIELSDLDLKISIDNAFKVKKTAKQKTKKGAKKISETENAVPSLLWRRGVPVADKKEKKSEIKVEFEVKTNSEIKEESDLPDNIDET